MPVRERRDLGQVGHDDDLRLVGEGGQPGTDVDGGAPADPGVDLVEDEGRRRAARRPAPRATVLEPTTSRASMTRDSSPPEAALATLRAGRPGLAASRISTSSAPCRAEPDPLPRRERQPVLGAALLDPDLDDGLAHREMGQLLRHPGCRSRAPAARRASEAPMAAATRAAVELGHLGVEDARPGRRADQELVEAGRRDLRPREHLVDRLAVLAGEHAEGRPALLHVARGAAGRGRRPRGSREVGREVGDEGARPRAVGRRGAPSRSSWAAAVRQRGPRPTR